MKTHKFITGLAALLLVLLFAYAGISKLLDWQGTQQALDNQIFPAWMAKGLLWGLPIAELAVAAMLVSGRSRLWGFWTGSLLIWLFTGYSVLVMTGYFGHTPVSRIGSLGWGGHLSLNLFFLGVALIGLGVQFSNTRR